ncbi:hypothetical protein LWI29_007467 [Acer saccharum]|uniref:Uncharacterized protein n=1 Tax=Acer saccharum TaxID=4024 RepID=A0AA39SCR7_ACESA|nr:hypothetical protein LWI29_007467 [Acer saccharum]
MVGIGSYSLEGMMVNILSRNISFSCGGKSVKFKVDRPKGSQVDDCIVLEAPKLRKKRSRVLTLVQAFESISDMKKGNHDCLNEQEAIELEEDDLATRTFEEIGTLISKIAWSISRGCDIVVEIGIAVQELEDTPIPQVVERRGWETFTSSYPMYYRKVVEEFYSRMVPEYFQQHGSVMVRGVEVRMTIADINKYYRTELPNDQQVVGRL